MNSFAPSAAVMIIFHMTPMKLIFPLMALGIITFIAIAKTAIRTLNNVMNLSMKSLKNGVDGNAFVARKFN